MRLLFLIITALAAAGCASSPSQDELQAFIADQPGFSGTILLGDTRGILAEVSQGFADDEEQRPFISNDRWRYASVTKQLVATLIMQEVEDGSLSLDDTLAGRLPQVETGYADSITLRDLLQHTSGLRNPNGLPASDVDPVNFCSLRAQRRPGRRFNYNNCDTILAAAMLEQATGASWEALMRKQIFAPARMKTVRLKAAGEDIETVAGYRSEGIVERERDVALYGASGGLVGTPKDLILFNAALMRGDLMSEESRAVLWEGKPRLGFVALGAWSFSAPLPGCEDQVALVERRGHIGGVQVRNIIAPDLDRSVVVFTNRGDLEFGEIWTGTGFTFELLSPVLCSA